MPTIAAGTQQTITLPANSKLSIGGGLGFVTVGNPSGSARPTIEEAYEFEGGTVGPFPTSVSVLVRATQAMAYSITPAIYAPTLADVYADQSGNLFAGGSPVSGAGSFPVEDAGSLGAPASFIELLGNYVTSWIVPTSEAVLSGALYASSAANSHCYVDPVNGNDSNNGYTPATAKQTINTAAWTGGMTAFNPNMFLLLKRGYTYTYTSPIGGAGGLSGGRSIGSYGDPSLPRPILRPAGAGAMAGNAALFWTNPDGASLCDIELDCSALDGLGQNHGVRFWSDTNTAVLRNVLVSGCKIRAPRTTVGGWPAGITVHKRTVENTAAAITRAGYVRIENNEVYGGGAHGIMLSGAIGYYNATAGRWEGADVINNWVHDCGKDYDSHAITSTGDAVTRVTPGAGTWAAYPWVLASGTTYYVQWDALVGRQVADIEMASLLFTSRDSCTHYLNKNTATPSTPGVGEFGFVGGASGGTNQRIYVNAGAALTNTEYLMTSGQGPRGVLYAFNRCEGMLLQGNTVYNEGAGLQFDDYTSDSTMICNRSLNNGGAGLAINFGARNKLVRNVLDGNARCGVLTNGHGTIIGGNVIRGGSNRGVLGRGLICQDMTNGPLGELVTQMRCNLFVATSQLDAYIYQTDVSGYRGNFTIAGSNYGIGPSQQQTVGKVMGF